MSLSDALTLAGQGFHVFRLAPGQKTPARTGWQREATCDPEKVRKLWGEGDWNIGIFTGRFGENRALLVVDVDTKHGKDGNATLLALELAGDELPLTLENATPTGGRHLVYLVDSPVKQGVDVLGSGLDIRSHGGYVVAPGSKVDAGEYFTDRPAAPVAAPAWLVARCGAPRARAVNRQPLPGIDPERARERAIAYLQNDAPEAIEGAGGDHTTFAVAAKVKDLGIANPEEVVDLLLEHWFDGCGWSPADLHDKVRNAFRYGANPPGADAPEAQFEVVDVSQDGHDGENVSPGVHPLKGLNAEWALVMTGGGHHMLWETTDWRGNPVVEHVKEASFHKYLASKSFQVGNKNEKLTDVWMAWPGRRTFDGLIFSPGIEVPDRWYNLWRGFSYAPVAPESASPRARAAVKAWQDHILRNICRGDTGLARWFTGYMAHLIQRPWEKPLTALVLKGKKGTGKNAVVERVGALFHNNLVVADDDRYLIGNFNSHVEACLLLVLDEASWAGGKKVEGKLKGLITGAEHLIERKGMEPYKVANLTRVTIIGNENWLVPASQDERRYAVFDVGEDDMQKRAFFLEMREGMEANGGEGYGLLLHLLQSFDLSTVDVNEAPKTSGLADQKVESLSPLHTWVLDCCYEGQILGGDFAGQWPEAMPTNRFQDAAKRHIQARGVRSWQPSVTAFNRAMKEIFPDWHAVKATRTGAGDTTYEYRLPPLDVCRKAMCDFVGKPDLFPAEE